MSYEERIEICGYYVDDFSARADPELPKAKGSGIISQSSAAGAALRSLRARSLLMASRINGVE